MFNIKNNKENNEDIKTFIPKIWFSIAERRSFSTAYEQYNILLK